MHKTSLLELLAEVQRGQVSPESASERLASLPFEDIGHARIDHHRSLRLGLPEVIYAAGKTPQQTAEIFARMAEKGTAVLATRASAEHASAVLELVPVQEWALVQVFLIAGFELLKPWPLQVVIDNAPQPIRCVLALSADQPHDALPTPDGVVLLTREVDPPVAFAPGAHGSRHGLMIVISKANLLGD